MDEKYLGGNNIFKNFATELRFHRGRHGETSQKEFRPCKTIKQISLKSINNYSKGSKCISGHYDHTKTIRKYFKALQII